MRTWPTSSPPRSRTSGFRADALGRLHVQFVRPVHGLIMLHGSRVIPGTVLALASGKTTLGHRFMSKGEIVVDTPESYTAELAAGKVVASFAERRAMIAAELDAKAAELAAHMKPSAALLDEVTALVEWPAVYVGEFESEYLEVPQECLILTMQQNQKYFPLFDAAGKLLNKFLIVSNMVVADPRHIIEGNARVVRPRLSDRPSSSSTRTARPPWLRVSKSSAASSITTSSARCCSASNASKRWPRRSPSASAPTPRWPRVRHAWPRPIYPPTWSANSPNCRESWDVTTPCMIARTRPLAQAIQSHYQPRFAGDALPEGEIACAAALSDKLDALVGFFGIGQIPTGDKDPFGLRRAALGVLRILMESPLALDLADLIADAQAGFTPGVLGTPVSEALLNFIFDRLRGLLKDAGHAQDVVEAVLAQRPTRIDLVPAKLDAVRAFLALDDAQALAAANKRIGNILKKAEGELPEPDPLLFTEAAERALFTQIDTIKPLVAAHIANGNYAGALSTLAIVRTEVDHFFDKVMVNVDDPRFGPIVWPAHSTLRPTQRSCRHFKAGRMKLVILDRDGVINFDSEQFVKSAAEWKAMPGSLEAIARLTQAGYRVVVATNQSGIGRGLFDMDTLNAMHEKMHRAVQAVGGRIDAVFYCPHSADSNCECRKPKPGMFNRIGACFNADLAEAYAVGDSLRDLQAAHSAGAGRSWCSPAKAWIRRRRRVARGDAGLRRSGGCRRAYSQVMTALLRSLAYLLLATLITAPFGLLSPCPSFFR